MCGFRGGYCWRVTPGLIPNPVVKSLCADGTALWWGGRVGRCHGFFWERGGLPVGGPPFFLVCVGWGVWWGVVFSGGPPFFCVWGRGSWGGGGFSGGVLWVLWWGWVLSPSPPRDGCRPHRTRQGDGVCSGSGVGGLDPCGAGGGWRLSGKGEEWSGCLTALRALWAPGLRPVRP